jgi:hypothetical protein
LRGESFAEAVDRDTFYESEMEMSEYKRPTKAMWLATGCALVVSPFMLEIASECPENSFCILAAMLPTDGPHNDPAPLSVPQIIQVTTGTAGSTVSSPAGSLPISLA